MNSVIRAIPRYAKAVAGGITTFGTAVGFALADDKITGYEWIGIVLAVLGGLGLVGGIPNTPKTPAAPAKPTVPPEFRA